MIKENKGITLKINTKTVFIFGIITGMIVMAGGYFLLMDNKVGVMSESNGSNSLKLVKEVSAAEIYPQFVCTCCGKPLDKDNICCGIAGDMISYIDQQVADGGAEDEVVIAATKKYGLKSLASETKKDEIKKQLAQDAPADSPRVSIEPLTYDFGEVSQAEGVVTQSFSVKNVGKSDLEINNLLSSCGCTSAALIVNGQEGPRFSMHNNPKNWSAIIKSDESAELKVYYDPNVHPDFRGLATREVTIFSNDPVDFEKSVKIKLNQVD